MLELIACVVIAPPLLALAVFSVELLVGLKPLPVATASATFHRAVVLVPAHDESASIERTVGALLRATDGSRRLLVVADNCTDSTAEIARKAGAEVIERHEPSHRGKGFALAFGRDFLSAEPPEVVVVVDADCTISRSSLDQLIARAAEDGVPVQAINLLTPPQDAPPLVQISNFAMLVKNLVRARGLYRIGGGIPLFGTGMAFPWSIFAHASLATGDTVEDLHLAVQLARHGTPVHLVEGANVLSPSAAVRDTLSQRRRWEHGFLQTARKKALPLVVRGISRGSRHQTALGLHLCVPPLALLLLLSLLCGAAAAAIGAAAHAWLPATTLFLALAVALACILLAWSRYGEGVLSAKALATAPLYVLRKVPLYLGFVRSRQSVWNRTPRE